MKSFIALLIVCAQIALAVKAGAVEGWGAAWAFILISIFFLCLVTGITHALVQPITHTPARQRHG